MSYREHKLIQGHLIWLLDIAVTKNEYENWPILSIKSKNYLEGKNDEQ